jgi:hypothetical protein
MPRGTIDNVALEAEIGRLPNLSLLELRNRWKTLFGHPAPKSLRRNFLARAVAYQMQVEVYGGLSAATKRQLREIANAVRNGDANAIPGGHRAAGPLWIAIPAPIMTCDRALLVGVGLNQARIDCKAFAVFAAVPTRSCSRRAPA